ncbi:MAG: Ig-like domain-containing protein [Gemmatimonadota bacterium]|nr:Ig-like domain-containing protein [Gemmatimonadota bacterium]
MLRKTALPGLLSLTGAFLSGALLSPIAAAPLAAQQDATTVTRLVPSAAQLTVARGDQVPFSVQAIDASGAVVDVELRITGPRDRIQIGDGVVGGLEPGEYTINVTVVMPAGSTGTPPSLSVPVVVTWPAVDRVEVEHTSILYAGTTVAHSARVFGVDGLQRPEAMLDWATSDAATATVDAYGGVTAHAAGSVTISASTEGVTNSVTHEISAFPGVALEITGAPDGEVRTGDVLRFEATVRDASGAVVERAPVNWSHAYTASEQMLGLPATGQMRNGAFVADVPGIHTVTATAGPLSARQSFEAAARDVVQELEVVGHGLENGYRTTDIWVFEGVDRRDYAITGSKVSGGFAFFYDVTDPAAITKIDSIQVDARTINDVKASPDGRYAVLSREGATNRRDGLVILDMADPRHPTVAALYDDGITGGVHNMFAQNDYLYALANGDKYVIIDVTDIYNPRYVSEYNHPDSRLHDVWVHDGLAYSSEWGTGVVVVDVGDGRWGGSPENPVFVTSYATPDGRTHATFPYFQESTGKTYLFLGDEIMNRRGLAWAGYPRSMGSYQSKYDPASGTGGIPLVTRGYIQIVDFTDPENPEMVARYEVPEFGTHNLWVEDDKLYQSYYEGGLRVVDISGELMGNLYTQGREIAVFKSASPVGYTPNATMVWGTQPFKGHVFFSDTNSGLWSVKLLPKQRPVS